MKNLKLLLLSAALLSFSIVTAQTTPTSVNRGNASFTQVDQYLSVIKRLGIPTATSDVLEGLTSGPNSAKILYNTTTNKLRIYNPVTSTWRDAIEADLNNYYTKSQVDSLIDHSITYNSTGIISGGKIVAVNGQTTFNIQSGSGVVVSYDNPINPTLKNVTITAKNNITPAYLNTGIISYIAINENDNIVQSAIPFTESQRRSLIILGAIVHSNLTNINTVNNISYPTISSTNQIHDLYEAIGALNINGNKYTYSGANLSIQKSAGSIFKIGSNFVNDWKVPSKIDLPSSIPVTFRYRSQDGTEGADRSSIDPTLYDLNGVLTAIPGSANRASIQRITIFQSGATRIQYGQHWYDNKALAIASLEKESFVVEPNIAENGIFRGYLVVIKGATNLSDINQAEFFEAGKFGSVVGNAGAALTYNNIIASLGFTPENVANKQNSLTVDGSGVKYPTVDAVNTGLSTKLNTSEKGAINGVATLNAQGKIPNSQIPAIALTETFVVNSQAEMLALSAERGDVAVRNDLSKSFILQSEPATSLSNWIELQSPSVENTDQVPEGSANLYFTEDRVRSTKLTGLGANVGRIQASDDVLTAFSKAQGQIDHVDNQVRDKANSDGSNVTDPTQPTNLVNLRYLQGNYLSAPVSDNIYAFRNGTNATGTWPISVSGASYSTQFIRDYIQGEEIRLGWNGSAGTYKVNNVDFGANWPINVTGSSAFWGGLGINTGIEVTDPSYIVGVSNSRGVAGAVSPTSLRSYIGSPANGETLTSVTTRDGYTSNAFGFNDGSSVLRFIGAAGVNYIQSGVDLSNSSSDLVFSGINGHHPKAVIKANGYFGVGKTNPSVEFDVSGRGLFSGTLRTSHTTPSDNNADLSNLSSTGYGLYSRGGGGNGALYMFRVDDYQGNGKFLVNGSGEVVVSQNIYALGGNSTQWNEAYNNIISFVDDRTIQPNDIAPQQLRYGFTSLTNNEFNPYADFLHFGGYQDGSGGKQNLIMFAKSEMGMRQYQAVSQSSSPYTDFVDYWHTGNLSETSINNWNQAYSVTQTATQNIISNAVVQRDGSAQINVPATPTLGSHATSKAYVDGKFSDTKVSSYFIPFVTGGTTGSYPITLDGSALYIQVVFNSSGAQIRMVKDYYDGSGVWAYNCQVEEQIQGFAPNLSTTGDNGTDALNSLITSVGVDGSRSYTITGVTANNGVRMDMFTVRISEVTEFLTMSGGWRITVTNQTF